MNVSTAKLKDALDNLGRILKTKVFVPLLSCIRLHAGNGSLELRASNMDEEQVERVECVGDLEPCCPMLCDLVNALGGVEMELSLDKSDLQIAFSGNLLEISTQSIKGFPEQWRNKFTNIGVSCVDLFTGIKAVEWAASREESRYIMRSVHVVGSAQSLVCHSTTGRELAIWESPSISADFEVLVPDSFAANLRAALVRDGAVFSIAAGKVRVVHSDGSYTCKQVEGMFPSIAGIVDKEPRLIGSCVVEELVEVFARCVPYAPLPPRLPVSVVEFSKQGGSVKFTGQDSGLALRFGGSFDPHVCKLNAVSFRKCLSAFDSYDVKIYAGDHKIILESGNLKVIQVESVEPFVERKK